eukprot:GHRR01030304.1.p1 GENE.GHRR01030304.1~~GHRR01030304.1.p1  ORF type:complete len:109 (+),score=38.82 GHRR01030304.1:824-1150(+)
MHHSSTRSKPLAAPAASHGSLNAQCVRGQEVAVPVLDLHTCNFKGMLHAGQLQLLLCCNLAVRMLTELSSISFIFLSLPAAMRAVMSGVAITALQQKQPDNTNVSCCI